MKKTTILFLLLTLVLLIGCREEVNLNWNVSEDRATVFGVLECDCSEADVEMLVTDENSGLDYISKFTVTASKRFERSVGVESDWTSINLDIIEVR